MYQPSQTFLAQMDTRPYRAFLLDEAGTRLELDTLEYTAGCVGSSFSLGNACAAEFTAKGTAGMPPCEQGTRVTLWAELLLQGEDPERVPMGRFILSKIQKETDSETITLTGTDAMGTELEREFFCLDPADPPATAPRLWQELGERSGLTLAGSELVPDTPVALNWDAFGGSGQTLRELAAHLALLSGANAVIDRSGALKLLRFRASDAAIGPERYYESGLTVEEGDFVFGALEVTVPGVPAADGAAAEQSAVYTRQLEGESRGLSYTGADYTQAVFDRVWDAWQGTAFRPASVKCLGNLLLDVGDVAAVTDRAGEVYALPVMSLRHSFDGGFTTTVTAFGPPQSGTAAVPQTATQAIRGLKTELGQFRLLYADSLSATQAALNHLITEDIQGENGTINLSKGTFRYGDVLIWDGNKLVLRGEINANSGTIGGFEIDGEMLIAQGITSGSTISYPMVIDPGVSNEFGFRTPRFGFGNGGYTGGMYATLDADRNINGIRLEGGGTKVTLDGNGLTVNQGASFAGPITSSLTTGSHLAGNQGKAIINSTAGGSGYTMLAKMNSTNGYFCIGYYQNAFRLYYTAKSVVDAGTNTITSQAVLLNESGNTSFPGTVSAASFSGTATSAKQVLDSGSSAALTLALSKPGLSSTSWLAAWNGYELRAISPANTRTAMGINAYVTSQGSSNGWWWRKWSNGVGECGKVVNVSDTGRSTWGNQYASNTQWGYSYPFSFKAAPMLQVTATASGDGSAWACTWSKASTTSTGNWAVLKPTNANGTYYLSFYAMGAYA